MIQLILDEVYENLVVCALLCVFCMVVYIGFKFGALSFIGIISVTSFSILLVHYVGLKVSRQDIIKFKKNK